MSTECEKLSNGKEYGLTCGFWTNSPDAIDLHVMRYHYNDETVYDLTSEQYEEDQRLRHVIDDKHEFENIFVNRYDRIEVCVKCGRVKDDPVHDVDSA